MAAETTDRRRDPAIAHAHSAMASMLRLGISPTPDNYLVWFSFHSDAGSPVRDALGGRLASGGTLHEAEMRDLHAKFFCTAGQAHRLDDLSGRLGDTLRDAAGVVTGAVEDATRYGASLQTFSTVLERAAGRVPPIVGNLLDETTTLRDRSSALAQELAETAAKIEDLRRELEEARRQATTDPLTGLQNRRAFDAELARLFNDAAAAAPICLLAFDLDRFKAVNDTHGHPVGDAVLRNVAGILKAASRSEDIVARLGGEEFVAVLPRTPPEAATTIAERIRHAVGLARMTAQDGTTFHVTVSIGIAVRGDDDDPESLLARADAALYAAKHGGRNQVRIEPAAKTAAVDWR